MSAIEQFVLSAVIFAVALLAGVLMPIAIRRLPSDYLPQHGRPPSSETALERGLRTAAGALLAVAGVVLLGRWPFRALILIGCGLAATSFPGKHQLVRRLLRISFIRDLVNGIRDSSNLGPLEFTGGVEPPRLARANPALELDIRQELAKKLAQVTSEIDVPGEANDRITPIGLRAIVGDPRETEHEDGSTGPMEASGGTDRLELDPSGDASRATSSVARSEPAVEEEPGPVSTDEAPALGGRPPSVSVDSMTLSQASLASPYLRKPGESAGAFSFDPRAASRSGFHSSRTAYPPPRRSRPQSVSTAEDDVRYADGDPVFTAYLSVTWHPGSRPTRGKNSVWWCSVERGRSGKVTHELKNPSTRVKALEQIGDIFSDWVARGVSGIACFDFPFGFPRGFGQEMGVRVPRWRGSWELVAGRVRDEQIGKKWNNRFEVADSLNRMMPSEGPFWAHPPTQEFEFLSRTAPEDPSLPESRHCDVISGNARSSWRMVYGAAAAGHALMGIPYVQHISTAIELDGAIAVWPFDRGSTKPIVSIQPRIILAEASPTFSAPFDDPAQPADANRVRGFSEHLERLDRDGNLAALLAAPDRLPDDIRKDVVTEEGWILGVPAPDASHWDSE